MTLTGQDGSLTPLAQKTGARLTSSAATASLGTIYAHDPDGRVTAVFGASSGAGSRIAYDADGNIMSVTPMPSSILAIAQVSPSSATPGTSITIYGTDFGSDPAAASVIIGSTPATIKSVLPNEISATVPAGATGSGYP